MNLQEHLLTLVMEECAEVQQAVSKMLRFGWNHQHPTLEGETAISLLRKEMLDLVAVVEMLETDGKLSVMPNHRKHLAEIEAKKERVRHKHRILT